MLTAIDSRTALILIDLQKGIVNRPAAHDTDQVIAAAARLAAAFRAKGLPVVIVHVNPIGAPSTMTRSEQSMVPKDAEGQKKALEGMMANEFFTIVPGLEVRPGDILITKDNWNAFTRTGLKEKLDALGITGIVLGGISTSIGVESTARTANEEGYNISFATDAMTDGKPEAHENSLRYIFPRLGELGTTGEIIALLDGLAGS